MNIKKTPAEVSKDILSKRNCDYCGAYELMKHDKMKKQCFSNNKQSAANNNFMSDSENNGQEKKSKKQGKLKSIQTLVGSIHK